MSRRGRFMLLFLLALVGAPAVLLLWRAAALLWPVAPVVLHLSDGRQILSLPLPRGEEEIVPDVRRVLGADGRLAEIPVGKIASVVVVPEVWTVRTDDGALRLGRFAGIALPDGDTLRGEDIDERIGAVRGELRRDRAARHAELVHAAEPDRAVARERWEHSERLDVRTGLLLRDEAGVVSSVRFSSVREMFRVPAGTMECAAIWLERIMAALADDPDRRGGSGLGPAFASTVALIALAGTLGGLLAVLAALLLNEWLRPGRWARVVRRTSGWLAAVPGVVWGAVGYGLLVKGFGGWWDAQTGIPGRWSEGGLFAGALTLGILAAPLSMVRALHVLDAVPRSWRSLARSCGATRWQVLHLVVLPAAWPGLLGAWLSAFARAAGETAPLLLVGALYSSHHSAGTAVEGLSLAGAFSHLGVMACDPNWPAVEAALGYPVAHLSLLVLTALCVGFELLATGFLDRRLAVPREDASP